MTSIFLDLSQIGSYNRVHLVALLKRPDLLRTGIGGRAEDIWSVIASWEYLDPVSALFLQSAVARTRLYFTLELRAH